MTVIGSLSFLVPHKPNYTAVMAKKSTFTLLSTLYYLEHTHLTGRATYIKGDPYIRDMRHTA